MGNTPFFVSKFPSDDLSWDSSASNELSDVFRNLYHSKNLRIKIKDWRQFQENSLVATTLPYKVYRQHSCLIRKLSFSYTLTISAAWSF